MSSARAFAGFSMAFGLSKVCLSKVITSSWQTKAGMVILMVAAALGGSQGTEQLIKA